MFSSFSLIKYFDQIFSFDQIKKMALDEAKKKKQKNQKKKARRRKEKKKAAKSTKGEKADKNLSR